MRDRRDANARGVLPRVLPRLGRFYPDLLLGWNGCQQRRHTEDTDAVRLVGSPHEHPRRYRKGPTWELLELLAVLPDDAGLQAVWRALSA